MGGGEQAPFYVITEVAMILKAYSYFSSPKSLYHSTHIYIYIYICLSWLFNSPSVIYTK